MLLGCRSEEPAARGTIARTPAVEMYRQASDALREAVSRIDLGVTPYVTASGEIEDRYRPDGMVSERVQHRWRSSPASYQDVETLLLSGQIDVAVMSPYAYVRAHAKDNNTARSHLTSRTVPSLTAPTSSPERTPRFGRSPI